jgi:hypothetical protein
MSSSAVITPFEQWRESLPGTERNWVSQVGVQAAFEAGYLAAVKVHDASGCPDIFREVDLIDVPEDPE